MRRGYAAFLLALLTVACGDGTNPSASTEDASAAVVTSAASSPKAAVTLAVSPNPVLSTFGAPGTPRQASWQIVLRETGGLGATVNFVNATLRDAATGVLAEPQGVISQSASDVQAVAGSNHLAAGGSLSVPEVVAFSVASGPTALGRLEVTVQLTDDDGNVIGAAATVPVQ